MVDGTLEGTSSAMRVGRACRSTASVRKSRSTAWTLSVRRSLVPSSRRTFSTSCRTLKRPWDPGTASTMERSSPRSFCHFLVLIRRCEGTTESSSSRRRSIRWEGNSSVSWMVSIIHPRITFRVAHVASPSAFFSRMRVPGDARGPAGRADETLGPACGGGPF
jgi:hypothetical protein